jgi:hypothetical protein
VRDVREHAARNDCEAIRLGWIGQPYNTASSLAFALAAIPLWRAAQQPGGSAWAGVAVAAAFEGIGSAGFHGPGGPVSKLIHDVGLAALAVTTGGALIRDPRARLRPLSVGLAAAALLVHTLSRTGGPLCPSHRQLQGHAVFHLLAAAALATAPPRALIAEAPADSPAGEDQ